jgi:hypothetical protein
VSHGNYSKEETVEESDLFALSEQLEQRRCRSTRVSVSEPGPFGLPSTEKRLSEKQQAEMDH